MDTFKKNILVTGTPAVGKTAVSRLLASRLRANHIDLGELVKREKLISAVDETRGTLIIDTERVSKRLMKIIRKSELDVIIDGHYAVEVVPAKEVYLVLVLRRDPVELKKNMERRRLKEGELWENLAAEILDVCLLDAINVCGVDKVCEIDTSGKEVREVVEDAISVLKGEKKCRVGIVDWLGKLDREKQLKKFLNFL